MRRLARLRRFVRRTLGRLRPPQGPAVIIPTGGAVRDYASAPDGARLALYLDEMRPPLRPWRWYGAAPLDADRPHSQETRS